ncbi:actin cytoskeleton organization [Ascochyta rabiei]|uniref:Actin cytoskeleton organization n=1 Tax=Didymella rabiei TaxID=5454 RepID=A0A163FC72_DIDRA|nr:actin cytoskeleton organization [Ascochyta rabiei]
MAAPAPAPTAGHRRHKSASVLKSIIGQHKRSPSDGTALKVAPVTAPVAAPYIPMPSATMDAPPLLPPDHPHSQLWNASNEIENLPILPPSPRKQPQDPRSSSPRKGLHKKTLSSVSLRTLGIDKAKEKQSVHPRRPQEEEPVFEKSKKTKSSTHLASMFGKSKSKKTAHSPTKDKENTAPFSSAVSSEPPRTPIWAQFSSQPLQDITTTTKVPLNDQRRSLEDDIAVYTPQNYSPSKQRDSFDIGQPSLQKRPTPKERPKSMHVPKTMSTASLLDTFSRKKSADRPPLIDTHGNGERTRDSSPSKSKPTRPALGRASTDTGRQFMTIGAMEPPPSPTKKPNRVMAAVAAFNGKAKQTDAAPASPTKLDLKVVDAEFEEVLESRNIPTHQRAAMRTLKIEVKADFVRTHKLDTPRLSTTSISSIGEGEGKGISKLGPSKSTKSRNDSTQEEHLTLQTSKADGTKRERPTSRTFTFNRSNSPTKKQRATELGTNAKPSPIPKSPSSRSLISDAASNRSVSNSSKTVKSAEFINYLKKTPKPQDVEVGKLHKLRLLLRNETVDWVDTFIQDGGMLELVGLLHRIMEIEWREDHEDTLLHELLRCLKGLCTTDSALKQLASISSTLYPALLGMLFDEEHKGPSEFTTRELMIQIIFAHIDMAPESQLPSRATELIGYLRDPVKEKESSTVPFILQMHTSRPYQVWCKEMTNVTKEVFWIFIHHLNVIPVPPAPSTDTPPKSYAKIHFPGPRAIVPAAPYVGGVEWDATNYVATHIDLLNGLLASLPTRQARNGLREELRISGFEKLMGHLRACNPKYYGAVHDSIKVWVGAALEDDWDVKAVRMGSGDKNGSSSPVKMSPKKKAEPAPQIDVPKLDLGLAFDREIDIGGPVGGRKDDAWI